MDTTVLSKELVSIKGSLSSVAEEIIQFSKDTRVWLFEGEMGAGKTTLIKEIGALFGVLDTVSSPTFSIVNEYRNGSEETYFHFDFYRIKSEEEASDIGVDEYFHSDCYCFVEWPSKIPSLLPDHYVTVSIEIESEDKRRISLSKK